jgi:hypothetical protein
MPDRRAVAISQAASPRRQDRQGERKAVHFGAVFAFEFCFLNAREFELLQPHIVLFG